MNWTNLSKCSSMEPIYSPESPTEVRNLSLKYQLEKSIYTDYIRLNETIFYRKAWTSRLTHSKFTAGGQWLFLPPILTFFHAKKVNQEIRLLRSFNIIWQIVATKTKWMTKISIIQFGQGSTYKPLLVNRYY